MYGDLGLPPVVGVLPYVVINMVSSVDGGTSVSGKASGIGGRVDRQAMRTLRSKVDAVMIGAGTLRSERLNLGLDDPALPQPLGVVVGGSGELPLANLINTYQRVLVVLPDGSDEQITEPTEVLYAPHDAEGLPANSIDLQWILTRLRSAYGVERLLIEGGPSLNQQMVSRNLVDEIFLTISPVLTASGSPSILSANSGFVRRDLSLVSVHIAEDHLFLRYRIRDTA